MDEQRDGLQEILGLHNSSKLISHCNPASGTAKVTVKQCAIRLLDHWGKLITGLNLGKLRKSQTVATSARSTRTCQGEEVIGCQPENTLNGKG
jgi:hypothetical protein